MRSRRTKAQVAQLNSQIVAVLETDHPQSVRHVFYRMTNPRLPEPVLKTEQGYQQVQRRITELRRSGRIQYGWITDATRRGYHVATYHDGAEMIDHMAGMYRSNLWADASHYVEVWCESRSIAGVIQDDCERLAVSLYPAGGFTSITLAYQSAQCINQETRYGERPAQVIYIGDYDPAGVLIDQSIEAELRKHLDPGVTMTFYRIAVTPEQIEVYDLPTKPRKETDRRSLHITETVEAEAMPARMLRERVRGAVESFLPAGALKVAISAEQSEREGLKRIAEIMRQAS